MKAPIFEALKGRLESDRMAALVTVTAGPGAGRQRLVLPDAEAVGSLGAAELDAEADRLAEDGFSTFSAARVSFEEGAETVELFCEPFPPAPKLFIIGAVHVAIHLCRFAREMGFRSVVIDPRTAFATPERFAEADVLDSRWPAEALADRGLDEGSYLATLSHDPKIDLPALEAALRSPARYIGALGSTRTHAKRVEALREKGFGDADLERIHAPIGLDLGGRKAEEIALAVIAEIVAASHGRRG